MLDRRSAIFAAAGTGLLAATMDTATATSGPGPANATLQSDSFQISIDHISGAIQSIVHPHDRAGMNWVSSDDNAPWIPAGSRWGLGYADLGAELLHRGRWRQIQVRRSSPSEFVGAYRIGELEIEVSRRLFDGAVEEKYVFTNLGSAPIPLSGRGPASLGIYAPFNDNYTSAADVVERRCHTHLWASGSSSWVATFRMGGRGPHLGMVMTAGGLAGYSIEDRDQVTLSNTRGTIVLHPAIGALAPGARAEIGWTLFWHDGWDDFFSQAAARSDQMTVSAATNLTMMPDEASTITISGKLGSNPTLTLGDTNLPLVKLKGKWTAQVPYVGAGDRNARLRYGDGLETEIRFHQTASLDSLMTSRVDFITRKQQWHQPADASDGAYLVYDNDMEAMARFERSSDRNDGRERLGMGVFVARWLRQRNGSNNASARASLDRYYRFVNEQIQRADGYVRDGSGRDAKRLYNWPWVMQLHVAMGRLTGDPSCWSRFVRTVESFYAEGGMDFYPIGLPVLEAHIALKAAGLADEHRRVFDLFKRHGEQVVMRGIRYPTSEVNYEQSIVAPAAILLLELHLATKEEKWLSNARPHVDLLALFEGRQPDHRLNGISIRHWDGYWFGKARMWGDTFPHYWSSLNALAWQMMAKATKDRSWAGRARTVLRGNLSLFTTDGRGSAAYIYPQTVNGRPGKFADPYANDQDWTFVHALQMEEI